MFSVYRTDVIQTAGVLEGFPVEAVNSSQVQKNIRRVHSVETASNILVLHPSHHQRTVECFCMYKKHTWTKKQCSTRIWKFGVSSSLTNRQKSLICVEKPATVTSSHCAGAQMIASRLHDVFVRVIYQTIQCGREPREKAAITKRTEITANIAF